MKKLFLACLLVGATSFNLNAAIVSYTYTAELTEVNNADTFNNGEFSDIQIGDEVTGYFTYDTVNYSHHLLFVVWMFNEPPNALFAEINDHSFGTEGDLTVALETPQGEPGFMVRTGNIFFRPELQIFLPLAEGGPLVSYDELPTDLSLFDWSTGTFELYKADNVYLTIKGNITNLEKVPVPSAFLFSIFGFAGILGFRRRIKE